MRIERKQAWYCEECEKRGSVNMYEGDGVMAVVWQIKESHRLKSPQCKQPITKIRILHGEE